MVNIIMRSAMVAPATALSLASMRMIKIQLVMATIICPTPPNEVGATWLRILSYSYFIYGWWMVSVQAFNGSGDTKTPTWINVIFFWLIQIPLAWLLAVYWDGGYKGVFWAVFVSETGVGLFTLYLFTRGKWKHAKV